MTRHSSNLIDEQNLEKIVEILKAVAHPVRLQIVNILIQGERSVGELIRILGTKQSLTSQQLTTLKLTGILKSRRDGNRVFYAIADKRMKKIMESVVQEA